MLTITVPSCPVCYGSHSHLVSASEPTVTLICPVFGESYRGTIALRVQPLPAVGFRGSVGRQLPLAV